MYDKYQTTAPLRFLDAWIITVDRGFIGRFAPPWKINSIHRSRFLDRERGRDFNTVVSGGPSVIATRSLIWRASAVSCLVGAPTTRYRSPFDRLSLIEHRPLHFTPLPFASRLFLLFVVLDFCFQRKEIEIYPEIGRIESVYDSKMNRFLKISLEKLLKLS